MTKTLRESHLWQGYLPILAGAFLLYLSTVAPGSLWQDNGVIHVRVLLRDIRGDWGLALSHPLFYLIAIAFQVLPLDESALKTNLVAACCGAFTVANVGLLLRLATGRWRSAIVGAVVLAVAHTFWQHSAMAETYTLTAALLTAELLCLLQFVRTGWNGWLVLLMLANGVGISNHLLATLALPGYGVLFAVLLARRKIGAGTVLAAAACWLVGSSIYTTMIVQDLAGGAGWHETFRSALFGNYARNVLNTTISRRELMNTVMYLGLNFPTPLVLLVPLGVYRLKRFEHRTFAVLLGYLVVIHLLWAMRYNVVDQYTFFVPTVVLFSVLMGLGADVVLSAHPRWFYGLVAAAVLPALIYIPLPRIAEAAGLKLGLKREVPLRNEYSYFLQPFKNGDNGPAEFTEWLRANLPPDAVLIADSTTVQPIHYERLAHGWRPDVTVFPPAPHETALQPTEEALRSAIERGNVFVVTPQRGYCPGWIREKYAVERFGVIWKVILPHVSASVPASRSE